VTIKMLVATMCLPLAACGHAEPRHDDVAFVVRLSGNTLGGSYPKSEAEMRAGRDVHGNVVEDASACAFADIRLLNIYPNSTHGGEEVLILSGKVMSDTQRACLKKNLPADVTVEGPMNIQDLLEATKR